MAKVSLDTLKSAVSEKAGARMELKLKSLFLSQKLMT